MVSVYDERRLLKEMKKHGNTEIRKYDTTKVRKCGRKDGRKKGRKEGTSSSHSGINKTRCHEMDLASKEGRKE